MKMIELSNLDKQDFSDKKFYPGTEGNPFDSILRIFNGLNTIHSIYFLFGITLFSFFFTFLNLRNWLMLLLFAAFDWLIIALLPKFKITFGPTHSQVFLLLLMRTPFIWLPFPFNLAFQIIGTALVLAGFVYEPTQIIVKQQDLEINKSQLKAPINFVQIGDIHLEKCGVRERKLLSMLKLLSPNFILFTGDFLNLSNNSDPLVIEEVAKFFSEINAIAPTYFVPGSPAVDLKESLDAIISKTKAIPLINQDLLLVENDLTIHIIGLDCTHKPGVDIKNLAKANKLKGDVAILMYHSPDLIYELIPEDHIDIMLSGHTHGGQVRLPMLGAIFTGSLYGRKLQSGIYKMGKTLLSISRGIGFEGMGAPRVRFLCKPEINFWTIKH
ncbi:MAG: hypothetical protein BGO78_01860 [Chloroflexi bacterium 44-23]|nr:MAG: hypothetical protein BGO78_01860 [Chloroflexi bacterium 44-23]